MATAECRGTRSDRQSTNASENSECLPSAKRSPFSSHPPTHEEGPVQFSSTPLSAPATSNTRSAVCANTPALTAAPRLSIHPNNPLRRADNTDSHHSRGATEMMAASSVAAEMASSGLPPPQLKVNIASSIQFFRRRSDPSAPFYTRESRRAHRIRDGRLGNVYAFVWKAGKECILVCTLQQTGHCCIPMNVRRMRMRVGDGDICDLDEFVQRGKGRTDLEIKAPLDASILSQNPRLMQPSPRRGSVDVQYIPLTFQIEIVIDEASACVQHLETTLYCRVQRNRRSCLLSVTRAMREAWERAPQSARNAANLIIPARTAGPTVFSRHSALH